MKPSHGSSFRRTTLACQRGVTLIVALIMLVVIGLASASLMRSSLTSDLVANNARLQTLAWQAAQVGLRYCEQQIGPNPPRPPTLVPQPPQAASAPQAWQVATNWAGPAVVTVPAAAMGSAITPLSFATLPQCMAEYSNDPALAATVVVTARGFSPDYAAGPNGQTVSGSVVWLQSLNR